MWVRRDLNKMEASSRIKPEGYVDRTRFVLNKLAFPCIREITHPPPANSRTVEVYGGFSWSKDCKAISNRADAVLLARLRAGHTPRSPL